MNVSILIDELEARKNDYILVADVINTMANATNSAPDEVVKYLDAHKIDEHMPLLYMDESYTFEPYNGHILGLGNDANITYYQKSDVMAFEPITKHGLFVDKTMPANLIHDVNQHKKNREDEYLTLSETLDFLNYNTDVNSLSYDHVKLRDIARRKLITPCFYFDGYVGSFRGDSNDSDNGFYTEIITGYFTYRLLSEEICSDDAYMRLPNNGVMIYKVLEKQTAEYVDYDDVFLFYDKPQGLDEAEKFKLTHIEADEIRFSKRELDGYIASLTNTSQDTPAQNDGELLAKLEQLQAENSDLNARLFTARNTYKQNQNEIKELKAQLEKANADNAALNEQLSNKTDAPNSVDELKGINKLNIEKSIFISTAKAIADYVWSMDKSEAIRTGMMVQQIKMIMSKADYTLMPDDDDTIRNWLSDIAPPHAKKSGRTPKDAPREITLIMKN